MSDLERPNTSPDREYQKRAADHFKKMMGADYPVFAAARLGLSVANFFDLRQDARKIDFRQAQEMLSEIESGLIRGFFTLDQLKSQSEDPDITPARFLVFCQRFKYFSRYAFCAVPEFFGLENGIDVYYDVDDQPKYKLFLKARGSIDPQFRFYYDMTSFLVLPDGSRDSLGSSRVLATCAPEEALRQFAFRLQPVAQIRISVGDFFDTEEDVSD